jgi:hypothetical protein
MKTLNMQQHPTRTRERGVALALALFAMAALLIGATGALYVGSDDIQASRNYRGAQESKYAAESGLTRALQAINAVGVINYESEVVNNWNNWLGASALDFALNGYTYQVTPISNAAAPLTDGWLRSTGFGPEGVKNVEVARVQQSNIPGTAPGAIYLANDDPTNTVFDGNSFFVDGNDYNVDGTLKAGGTATPGIATKNQENAEQALADLSGGQQNNVQGLGYDAGPPATASIKAAPSAANVAQFNALIDTLLAQPDVNSYDSATINPSNKTFQYPLCGIGCCTDTSTIPTISHFTSDLTVKGNGNVTGCGILIVDGDLIINGTLDFLGLILVRGGTIVAPDEEASILGDANIYGSLWTSDLNFTVGGTASVRYSTEALAFANSVITNGAFPAPLNVLSLVDCSQVPAGSNGCP